MSTLSTHVLDTARGRPAAGMDVALSALVGGAWTDIAQAVTDGDGRIRFALPAGTTLAPGGTYRLRFETGPWFKQQHQAVFYPVVEVTFILQDDRPHHVPVLLSPFGYTTYRGS